VTKRERERKRVASPLKGCVPFSAERLVTLLAALDPEWRTARFCVALSGGIDSTVLLHAAAALARGRAVSALRAVHVNHGLHADAPRWARACEALCAGLGVPMRTLRLDLRLGAGASVEAEARSRRYAALAAELAPGEWLLTAHHRQDQLETLLLQLFRGAGVAGLAAMPVAAALGAGRHGRPLLDVDRAEIEDYARAERLEWIEDPMNAEARFDRGWLRKAVLPQLLQRWPALPATVSRTVRHLASAQQLLESLAELDGGALIDGDRLEIRGLSELPADRQSNVLRWWLARRDLPMPSEARLRSIREDLVGARPDAMPVVQWGGAELRRYRGRLYALPRALPMEPGSTMLAVSADASAELGAGLGRLTLDRVTGSGLRLGSLGERLEVRFRAGGESLRPVAGRPRRTLRNLYQEAGIVPWMRSRLPLLYCGGRLVAVADLWLEADLAAGPGEEGLQPRWEDRPGIY